MLLVDIIQVTFWYVVFHAYQWAMAVVMWFVPTALARTVAEHHFAQYGIKVTMENSSDHKNDDDDSTGTGSGSAKLLHDDKKYTCEVVVRNPHLFRRVQVEDILGIGESYMVCVCFRD